MSSRALFSLLLRAESCLIAAAGLSAEAEELGQQIVAREVIEERGRAITIYEVVTPYARDPVAPHTVTVTRHTAGAPPQHDKNAVEEYCLDRLDSANSQSIEPCIASQTAALRRVTEISNEVRHDAGLTNIIETCMLEAKAERGYDWPAVALCYDHKRGTFFQLYAR